VDVLALLALKSFGGSSAWRPSYSTRRLGKGMAIKATSTVSAELTVDRGLNELRLAVLGILVAIGLTVGFGAHGTWYVRVVYGLAGFVASAALIKWSWTRHKMMLFMHWWTGR
jgi:hypothetical protein